MKKALKRPHLSAFLRKWWQLFVMVLAFSSAQAQSDATRYSPINGYGFKYKRIAFDSIQLIPLYASPHIPYRAGAIKYREDDSSLYKWTGTQWLKEGSGSGGSGTDNLNVGLGFRILKPGTQELKTLFSSNTILWDSTSNTDGLTAKVDTSVLATQFDLSQVTPALPNTRVAFGNTSNVITSSQNFIYDSVNKKLTLDKGSSDSSAITIAQNFIGSKRWLTVKPPITNDSALAFLGVSEMVANDDLTRSNHVVKLGSLGTDNPQWPRIWDTWETNWFTGGANFLERHYSIKLPNGDESRLFSSTFIARDSMENSENTWDFRATTFNWKNLTSLDLMSLAPNALNLFGNNPVFRIEENSDPNAHTDFQQVGEDLSITPRRNINFSPPSLGGIRNFFINSYEVQISADADASTQRTTTTNMYAGWTIKNSGGTMVGGIRGNINSAVQEITAGSLLAGYDFTLRSEDNPVAMFKRGGGFLGLGGVTDPIQRLHVGGQVQIDTVETGTNLDSLLVINNGKVKKIYAGDTSTITREPLVTFEGLGLIPDTIAIAGLNGFGTAGQGIRVNAGEDGLEYFDFTGGGSGDFSTSVGTSVDGEIVVFDGTTGKLGKRFTGTGFVFSTSGVGSVISSTGTGNVVLGTSPTIVTPTIASLANANHNHENSAGGGQIDEDAFNFTDVNTMNSTTGRHGLLPKLSGNSGNFLDGTGSWSTPGGSGDVISNETSNTDGQLPLFGTQTDGKHLKKFTSSGLLLSTSGVVSAVTTSAGISGALSDEEGSGAAIFGTQPTFTTDIKVPLIYGSVSSGANLTLGSTSHATKGKLLFGTSAYDEANNRLGIGTASPSFAFDLTGQGRHLLDGNQVIQRVNNSNNSYGLEFRNATATAVGNIGHNTSTGSFSMIAASGQFLSLGGGGAELVRLTTGSEILLGNPGTDEGAYRAQIDGISLLQSRTALTTTISSALVISHTTSGTAAAGLGAGMQFQAENGSGTNRITGSITNPYRTPTNAAEDADMAFNNIVAGTVAEKFRMTSTGLFTIGGITSSQPALAANGVNLRARLADNSASTDLEVLDEAYDATAWNGSLEVPTKNAVRDKIEAMNVSTGTYTPTLSNITNVDASTLLGTLYYTRIGNTITVRGVITIDATAALTLTTITITLPVASALTAAQHLSGQVTSWAAGAGFGTILADATNDIAQLDFQNGSTTSSQTYSIWFSYEVL